VAEDGYAEVTDPGSVPVAKLYPQASQNAPGVFGAPHAGQAPPADGAAEGGMADETEAAGPADGIPVDVAPVAAGPPVISMPQTSQ
jgi:hypothetical protein